MEAALGKTCQLKVLRKVSIGLFLDGGGLGDILLPNRYVTDDMKEDEDVEVFVYLDSEDRIIATTEVPYAEVGEFAYLEVAAVSKFGAFLDWGLMKDLLVPFREQTVKMEKGKSYLVHIYIDYDSNRIVASAKYDRFLDNLSPDYEVGEEVDLIISEKTDLGYKAIVNNLHSGLLYDNQVFRRLSTGQKIKGYISKIREDNKIDLLLEKPGIAKLDDLSERVLQVLKVKGGFIGVSDKSSPDVIASYFGMSKKNFKKAIGRLYKERIIQIEPESIRLLKDNN